MNSKTSIIFVLSVILIGFLIIIPTVSATHFKCAGSAKCLTGTVTKIIDGDTLVINKSITVRLAIVDTPEKTDRANWKRATDFTTKLCLGSIVKLDEDDKQQTRSFNRIIGVVYCGEKNLNAELTSFGLAKSIKKFCKISEFSKESWAISSCQTKNQK